MGSRGGGGGGGGGGNISAPVSRSHLTLNLPVRRSVRACVCVCVCVCVSVYPYASVYSGFMPIRVRRRRRLCHRAHTNTVTHTHTHTDTHTHTNMYVLFQRRALATGFHVVHVTISFSQVSPSPLFPHPALLHLNASFLRRFDANRNIRYIRKYEYLSSVWWLSNRFSALFVRVRYCIYECERIFFTAADDDSTR